MNGIYIDVFWGISYDELFPMIKDIGFTGFFSGECYAKDPEKLTQFKRSADSIGLIQETSHSTIPGCSSIWSNVAEGDEYIDLLKLNIDNCAKLDIPILVVHIQPDLSSEPSFETGLNRLRSAVKYARERRVKIAFENINSAEYLYNTLDFFDCDNVGFCYDCGHEACHTNGERYLSKIGDRLLCTHIHDNDNKSDQHLIPFDGSIDFIRIASELNDCNYKGNITLELCYDNRYQSRMSKLDFLKKSFDAAKKLKKMMR
ncbi:MAG: sugar phosphate isomerase/epimerase [Clostridia bacterium]|nr:sugar phosphate isomerase/epimerase [Clostridia bacterium]